MAKKYTTDDIMATLVDLRDATALGFAKLRSEMNERFENMNDRFEKLEDKMNRRFDSVDLRFDAFERRVSALEQR